LNKNVDIILRSIAAVIGGYVLSALSSIYLTYGLVNSLYINDGVAVLSASMLSYIVFFAFFIASFAVSNIAKWLIFLILLIAVALLFLPLVDVL
jgi:hypothetical protein